MLVPHCGLSTLLWCVFIVFIGNVSLNQAAYLRCYYDSIDDYEVAKLENGHELLNTSCYNCDYRNLFYTFGFRGKTDGNATRSVINAFVNVSGINLFLLDWEKEASSIEYLGTFGRQLSYLFSGLPQSRFVGKILGKTLLRMSEDCLNLNKTELMGHSLGAQLMGNTGRELKKEGKPVDMITGLDPAGPLFTSILPISPTLDYTCAQFVFIIYTDPGGYGTNSSTATVNAFANFGNFINGTPPEQVQPGCPKGVFEMFSVEDICSHDRSWKYRIAALMNKRSVLASNGTDYYAWAAAEGDNQQVIDINDVDRSATGNFYFSTNSEEPFARYEAGLSP